MHSRDILIRCGCVQSQFMSSSRRHRLHALQSILLSIAHTVWLCVCADMPIWLHYHGWIAVTHMHSWQFLLSRWIVHTESMHRPLRHCVDELQHLSCLDSIWFRVCPHVSEWLHCNWFTLHHVQFRVILHSSRDVCSIAMSISDTNNTQHHRRWLHRIDTLQQHLCSRVCEWICGEWIARHLL